MPTPTPPLMHPFDPHAPDDDAPMTDKQAAILRDLTDREGLDFDGSLTKAQADERIAALRERQD